MISPSTDMGGQLVIRTFVARAWKFIADLRRFRLAVRNRAPQFSHQILRNADVGFALNSEHSQVSITCTKLRD